MSNNTGFSIKEGRISKQYINTNFDFIDALNQYADCETLGFYISFKRYINRKNNTKENQITYSQAYLEKQLNVGRTKYYRHLKTLFNVGLCDVEKIVEVKFFINYNLEGKENPSVQKSIVYFSTLENIDISLKNNLENLINEYYPEIPKELIKIIDVVNKTFYIFHDCPPVDVLEENNYKFVAYRNWDIVMNRFSSSKNVQNDSTTPSSQNEKVDNCKDEIDPPSQNKKEGASQNKKDPPSQNRKVNNIIELNNNIIESSNSIINQSIMDMDEKKEIDKNNEFDKKDVLIDLDKQIKKKGFIPFEDLVNDLGLNNKQCYSYPYDDWVEVVKKAIYEMYYFDDTRIRGRNVSRFDAISKLQNLNYDMIISTIDNVIESSKEQEISYPSAFIKSTLYNEISEYSAKIQAMVNYDLSQERRTRFHNFQQRSDKYADEELEDIARGKRETYHERLEGKA
ncbi:hypothetical protein CIW83_03055 [Tissierella sp. P1]|uniref:hypothetical protein n=1 Tax=Tissierella sp. P1 TaxID=1280483 RepID=UPI000BA102A6|nr:hypothetical protein [Tissierella sp. P1]OZV13539.1 hypothetical protein CIW83_03055 [Tissierella sp. P1]